MFTPECYFPVRWPNDLVGQPGFDELRWCKVFSSLCLFGSHFSSGVVLSGGTILRGRFSCPSCPRLGGDRHIVAVSCGTSLPRIFACPLSKVCLNVAVGSVTSLSRSYCAGLALLFVGKSSGRRLPNLGNGFNPGASDGATEALPTDRCGTPYDGIFGNDIGVEVYRNAVRLKS